MSKVGRRKNLKSKIQTEPPKIPEKSTRTTHQTDIATYLVKQEDTDLAVDSSGLPEVSLPSPDDAALPCASSLCSNVSKSPKKEKLLNSDKVASDNETNKVVEKSKKISDMTNKVIVNVPKKKRNKKKPQQQCRSSQLTDFFPARRSNRKTLVDLTKEKHKFIEEAILSEKEEGFEIKEFPEKGRGIITLKAFKRGDFVMEYFGELIDYEEALRRESAYAMKINTGCYMYYFKSSDKRYCIDSTKESHRLGRLINHSKKGNLKTQPFYFEDSPRLAFFAHRDIAVGEELSYDYGDRSKQSLQSHPWLAL